MDNHNIISTLDPSGELYEIVTTRKWPIIFEHCERQLKKSGADEAWKVVQAAALLADARDIKKDAGLQAIQALLEQGSAITDPGALILLECISQSIFDTKLVSPHLSRIWDRAAQGLSGDTSWLFKLWFRVKFLKGRFGEAKQATMAWMKAYPNDHDPFYLFILINDLIARLPQTPALEVKLCTMLAVKALTTAASAIPPAKGNRVGRVLAFQDDLAILLEIYQRQAKHQDALNVLQSPSAGPGSIAKESWPLTLTHIELKGLCGDFESQWTLSYDILRGSKPPLGKNSTYGSLGDDWKIWNSLVTAALKLSGTKPEFIGRTEQLFADFETVNSRNAGLAQLKMYALLDDKSASSKLLKKCQSYLEKHSRKPACMHDMRPHLAGLLRSHQEVLVKSFGSTEQSTSTNAIKTKSDMINHLVEELNRLKLDYNFIVVRTRHERKSALMTRLVQACLQLHRVSIQLNLDLPSSDQGPLDDALVLAALALVHLYRLGDRPAILKAVVVLEYLLPHSKHNYEAMLVLIQLYMYLGLGALAIDRYARLSIKNIQHASISWILFPRLSRIHPHPVQVLSGGPASSVFNPLQEVKVALDWYDNSGTMTSKAMDRAITGNQYPTIIGLLETQELLQSEVSRMILHHEHMNLTQLQNHVPIAYKEAGTVAETILDSRDRSAFPNYEPTGQAAFVDLIPSVVPRQVDAHLSWLSCERESQMILGHLETRERKGEWPMLKPLIPKDLPQDLRAGSTAVEVESLSLLQDLDRLVSAVYAAASVLTDVVASELEQYTKRISTLKDHLQSFARKEGLPLGYLKLEQGRSIPTWICFHGYFTLLSTARSVKNVCSSLGKVQLSEKQSSMEIQAKFSGIASECEKLVEVINAQARTQRENIKPTPFREALLNEVTGERSTATGNAFVEVIGTEVLEGICTKIGEAWIDAFDGVIKSSAPS